MKKLLDFSLFFSALIGISVGQIIYPNEIQLLDIIHQSEPSYYDLSYLNTNLVNDEKYQFRTRRGSYKNDTSCDHITKVPFSIRTEFHLSYFYQKFTEAFGIPIIGSNRVSNNALKRACYTLRFYLENNQRLKEEFYRQKIRVVLIANSENLCKIPEYKSLQESWSSVKGLSARKSIPLITVVEDNVECTNNEAKSSFDILFHQITYSLVNIDALDQTLTWKLNSLYKNARESVPWRKTFALEDVKEYLASAVDVYYNATEPKYFTLAELKVHDNELVQFIDKLIPCNYEYLNRCDSSRELENFQKLAADCKSVRERLTTTTTTTTSTTTTTTTTTTSTTTTRITTAKPISTTVSTQQITFLKDTTVSSTVGNSFNLLSFQRPTSHTFLRPAQIVTTSTTTTTTTEAEIIDACRDNNEYCQNWASRNQCTRNSQFMHVECKKSCGLCDEDESTTTTTLAISTTSLFDLSMFLELCKDEFTHCPVFAKRGDCKNNPHYMLDKCKRSCNLCGDLVEQKDRIQVTSKKMKARRPFVANISETTTESSTTTTTTTTATTTTPKHGEKCLDLASHCAELAARGDCQTNQPTMAYYCSKSCKFC